MMHMVELRTRSRARGRVRPLFISALLAAVVLLVLPVVFPSAKPPAPEPRRATRVLKPAESDRVLGAVAAAAQPQPSQWHPPHVVKVWMAVHKGRTFRVTQLPHCEHIETLITYDGSGETLKQAKQRTGGIAACTGSFHNSQTMALADFLQRDGAVLSPARTGRNYMAVHASGGLDISGDYSAVKGKTGVSALALGQRLLPLQRDGFSTAFMNRVTDRMAVGLNANFIFIIQGKSDIWRLAHFIEHKLPARTAINCDGGHVVRGKGPVHIVFRWKTPGTASASVAGSASAGSRSGGS